MTDTILEAWNRLPQPDATEAILPCNGSVAWAIAMVNARPVAGPGALFSTSDAVWQSLTPSDWQQAFDSHPRIGERKAKAASAQSLSWSEGEQSAAAINEATEELLAAANKAYEQKFGRIFIVCASGKLASEMLAILDSRLNNDPSAELQEAAEQQRQITQLRLRKWLRLEQAEEAA